MIRLDTKMRKNIIIIQIFVCLLLSCSNKDTSDLKKETIIEEINSPETEVESVIENTIIKENKYQKNPIRRSRLSYGESYGEPITDLEEFLSIYTDEELQEVTQLHIGMNKIEKISGLERLPNLEDLVVNMNNISDIAGIYIPPKLSYISIGRNPISDISYLFDYPQFEGINIEYTNVSSLDGIEKLHDLKSLIMTNAKIEDFSPLLKLTKLEYILVRFNPGNQMDSSEFREKLMESNPNLEPFES